MEQTGALVCIERERLRKRFGNWVQVDGPKRVFRKEKQGDKWVTIDPAQPSFDGRKVLYGFLCLVLGSGGGIISYRA